MVFRRIILIVLDGFGIGEQPDAAEYGDVGANTLKHILAANPNLKLPNLFQLGLGKAAEIFIQNYTSASEPTLTGGYGKLRQLAAGKDTLTGHLEMMGIWLKEPFKLFPEGFPDVLIEALEQKINRPVIGNIAFSGTKIIEDLGVEQMRTGAIIVYTSADSVLQIAAHEDVVPVNELYKICEIARDLTQGEYLVGRVIARPFRGEPGSFYRTERRRDYPLPPPANTVLDSLIATGLRVEAVGKIADIFTGRGITDSVSVTGNSDGTRKIVDLLEGSWQGLLFANLNDFDTLYGHRRDVEGYAKATSEFDEQLPSIMNKMRTDDLLIITADHGNDPTFVGSDHTREYAPLLVYYPGLNRAVSLGERSTFADIGCTIADNFQLAKPLIGRSFLTEIVN